MENVMVVGAGFMGAGIAQVCAQSGYRVFLMDTDPDGLEKALGGIKWSIEKFASKGFLKETPRTVLKRIAPETGLENASQVQWCIEAVYEDEELKLKIFEELDHRVPADTPLASNTSSIPITRLARVTQNPARVLGLHFFGPVPFMGLVEVVRGQKTSEEIFNRGAKFVQSLGKTPVKVNKDIPGFVMNRIFGAAFRECVDLVADGIASPEDIDVGMRLGYGWNVGPFEIADNAGLDTFVRVGRSMQALGEENLVAKSDLILKMVEEGRLGRKVGKGFYKYDKDGKKRAWNS
ncbi:Enoyl-CoA hydratase [isoleucine degradation] (EC / 3-hydroxyacyl-CoA dehydrogenase (EC / 3-hydroxybutyryl-CoA epimerase (EC [Olavius sp. associated proteobacterium Delta 1]|nr:Enoyl-CoA hydratase [isoleucine degradation] (EC / 3-hydroxyacyl-CoA dehydrogenase (EC / 3-hydroxybutyryl-CoA epimerase (EC [Olavius sp. associated proteobacterium Delta 1]